MPSVDDTVYRYFNDYLQLKALRTADTDINTGVYEALGDMGYTGHITERVQQAAGALSTSPGGFYSILYEIASTNLLGLTPADLGASLLVWWDPSDLTTLFQDSAGTTPVTAESEPVGLMNDKSGNSRHISQATAASRPAYQADGSLLFDGTADCLLLASQPFPSGSNPCEMWAITRQDALVGDTGQKILVSYGGTLGGGRRQLVRVVSSGVNRFQATTGDGSTAIATLDATTDFSDVHIVRASISATQTFIDIDGNTSTPTSVIPSTGTVRLRIGATPQDTAANFWVGKVGPVIITGALTGPQIRELQRYYDSITLT